MADKIIRWPSASDQSLYAIIRDPDDGKVWNGSALVTWVDANVGTYDVPLAFHGGDAYGFTIPAALPRGKNYVASFYIPTTPGTPSITDSGHPDDWEFRWNGSAATPSVPPSAVWTYSDQTYFNLFNGTANTDLQTDLDRDAVGNPEVLQAAGERGDTYIDSRLVQFGWTLPLSGLDARTTALLRDLSNHAARWQLAEAHQFGLIAARQISPDAEAAMAKADKQYVDEWLERIRNSPEILGADSPPGVGWPGDVEDPTVITGRYGDNTVTQCTLNDPRGNACNGSCVIP